MKLTATFSRGANEWGELTASLQVIDPVEVRETTGGSSRLQENYQSCFIKLGNIPQIDKENLTSMVSTHLDLVTLGSSPIMHKNPPRHCVEPW
jgi:hypothetical protein